MTARVNHVSFKALLAELCSRIGRLPGPRTESSVYGLITEFKAYLEEVFERPELYYKRSREAIYNQFGKENPEGVAANKLIRMTKKEFQSSRKHQQIVTIDRNKHQTVITMGFILTRTFWLRTNGLIIDKVALLMLATGARRCELLQPRLASFLDPMDGVHIKQFGLAKKTDACQVICVLKPILWITPREFMEMLADVRAYMTDKPPDALDNQLESLAKVLFPQFEANGYRCGTHVCRALYANTAHSLYARPNESLTAFAADVLGHEGLPSVPNYLHVRVVEPDGSKRAKQEAREQLARSNDKLQPVEIMTNTGQSRTFLPMPRRKLTPDDRAKITENYMNRLALDGVVPTLPIRLAMNMIST